MTFRKSLILASLLGALSFTVTARVVKLHKPDSTAIYKVSIRKSTISTKRVFGPGMGTPAPTVPPGTSTSSPMVDTPIDVKSLAEYNGIYLDRTTGMTYVYRCPPNLGWGAWDKDDCQTLVPTTYTFESATWRSGIDALAHIRWPWLNPLDFATQETARRVAMLTNSMAGNNYPTINWTVNDQEGIVTGPFTRTTMWMVCGDNGSQVVCFSAGGLANRLIRNPSDYAKSMLLAEIKQAFGK